MKQNSLKGFTLLELLVVMAIISILSVVALPTFVNYATRSKVSEGLAIAAGAKIAVMDAYLNNEVFPVTNAQAGLGLSTDYARQFVIGLTVGSVPSPGAITVELDLPPLGTDNLLQLVPTFNGSTFDWTCQVAAVNGLQGIFVPGSCR